MSIQEYLEKMKNIQKYLLEFIENEDKYEENYQNLIKIFDDNKIQKNRYDLKALLHLIVNIANNHYRGQNFFSKIEKIILLFEEEIKNYFTNTDIFNIFETNKRLLLFLIQNKILNFDKQIAKTINYFRYKYSDYQKYFAPEIKPYLKEIQNESYLLFGLMSNQKKQDEKEPDDFDEKRKIGENDDPLCEIIRKDDIEEFIIFVNKNNSPLDTTIKLSVYETNNFLIRTQYRGFGRYDFSQHPKLIEYAAFSGSIQIFNYLYKNGVLLTSSLWLFAIHGKNPEIIRILEENKVIPSDSSFNDCYQESIKCHHNGIANYIEDNLLSKNEKSSAKTMSKIFKAYNFDYFTDNLNQSTFMDLCKYDHYTLVDILLKTKNIDISQTIIYTIFLMLFLIDFFFNRIYHSFLFYYISN